MYYVQTCIFCLNGLELDPESWVIVATSRRLKKTVSDSDVTRALEHDIYDMNMNKLLSTSLQYYIYLNPNDARYKYETH